MVRLERLDDSRKEEWDELIKSFPGRTVFHCWNYLKFLKNYFGMVPLHLGIFDEKKLVGLFPALEFRKGPLRIIASPLTGTHTGYMGPLVPEQFLTDTLYSFYDYARKNRYEYLEITFPFLLREEQIPPLVFNAEKRETFMVQIREKTLFDLRKRMTKGCKWTIAKAVKNRVEVVEVDSQKEIGEFYEMLKASFRKHKAEPSKPVSYYYGLREYFEKTGQVKFLLARYNNKNIAGGVFFFGDRDVYYLSGGSFSGFSHLGANNLIQWRILEQAVEKGLEHYNMYGAGNDGIAEFKKSFGPERVQYTHLWKALTLKAKLGRDVYLKFLKIKNKAAEILK